MCYFLSFFFLFLGPHPQHMGAPRLGVESELQLPAYTTATATQDPSRVCKLHHSSWQHWILNPLREARDGTHILMNTSWVRNLVSYSGSSLLNTSLDFPYAYHDPRHRIGEGGREPVGKEFSIKC